MVRRPPRSTRSATLLSSTTLVRSAGSEDAGRRSTLANPKSPIPNPGFLAIHRELRALLQHVLAHARDDLLVLRVVQHVAHPVGQRDAVGLLRSEEHTSELQSLMRISYAVFCLKKKN